MRPSRSLTLMLLGACVMALGANAAEQKTQENINSASTPAPAAAATSSSSSSTPAADAAAPAAHAAGVAYKPHYTIKWIMGDHKYEPEPESSPPPYSSGDGKDNYKYDGSSYGDDEKDYSPPSYGGSSGSYHEHSTDAYDGHKDVYGGGGGGDAYGHDSYEHDDVDSEEFEVVFDGSHGGSHGGHGSSGHGSKDKSKKFIPGKDGHDGHDGRDGADGKDGKDGPRGPAGPDGKPGRDGADGEHGEDGEGPLYRYVSTGFAEKSVTCNANTGQQHFAGQISAGAKCAKGFKAVSCNCDTGMKPDFTAVSIDYPTKGGYYGAYGGGHSKAAPQPGSSNGIFVVENALIATKSKKKNTCACTAVYLATVKGCKYGGGSYQEGGDELGTDVAEEDNYDVDSEGGGYEDVYAAKTSSVLPEYETKSSKYYEDDDDEEDEYSYKKDDAYSTYKSDSYKKDDTYSYKGESPSYKGDGYTKDSTYKKDDYSYKPAPKSAYDKGSKDYSYKPALPPHLYKQYAPPPPSHYYGEAPEGYEPTPEIVYYHGGSKKKGSSGRKPRKARRARAAAHKPTAIRAAAMDGPRDYYDSYSEGSAWPAVQSYQLSATVTCVRSEVYSKKHYEY